MRNAIVLGICLLVSACGGSPKVRYYTLQAPPAPASAPDVAIAPVGLPEAVDRSQIVVRTGGNTVDISDVNRWAEPLKSGVARVLRANVMQAAAELGGTAGEAQAIRITLDVSNFDAVLGQSVDVAARWSVKRGDEKPLRGASTVCQPLFGDDYAAVAAGYERALAQIGKEIAVALQNAGATR